MDSEAGSAATPDPGAGAPEQGYPSILDDETDRRMHAGFAEYGGVEVTIGNSAHEDFTDAPYLSRKAALLDRRPDGHAIRIAVECTATFFDAVFRGQDSPSCETGSANTRIKVWRPTAPDAPAK
jgi:hypothetical protein